MPGPDSTPKAPAAATMRSSEPPAPTRDFMGALERFYARVTPEELAAIKAMRFVDDEEQ